ncbi:MAG: hypothetical protein ACFFAN_16005 [Promethearchaeota archaeon]
MISILMPKYSILGGLKNKNHFSSTFLLKQVFEEKNHKGSRRYFQEMGISREFRLFLSTYLNSYKGYIINKRYENGSSTAKKLGFSASLWFLRIPRASKKTG